ncbi:hypothetical protein E2493_14360 [Sphingomonas parva]|uniref:Uncharacterized protein n=1 Tax=Sphingomonas parva TaxID=2555898 RepID=A0A4Y8ZNI2_9SPHN|nr:hypothetical protein [Sphingomonas parva]TFI57551.1 hypothetical protein E2493_14360 [Sphingomonas parva]
MAGMLSSGVPSIKGRRVPWAHALILLAMTALTPIDLPASAQISAPAVQSLVMRAAEVDRWPGPARITSKLTPVKITLENHGPKPVLLAYNRIKLVGRDGREFRTLPLYRVQRSAAGEAELPHAFAVRDQKFEVSGFRLARLYGRAYPGQPLADTAIGLDPAYYALYESYYDGEPLPTTGMRRWGLPEGVLDPGGRVEGYLYFEKAPNSAEPLTLKYELVDALSGASSGIVSVVVDD